jgi:hypothetical protein
MGLVRRLGVPATLAVAFAIHVGLTGVLAGRTAAPPLCLALSLGALAMALVAAANPIAAARSLDPTAVRLAIAGGTLSGLVAPALVASNRMTDAPSGSVTVWWISAGWAAIAVTGAAALLWRRSRRAALSALAGGLAVLAGAAGVLANWERPSSFSPLVKYPAQEVWMLAGGAALVCGGLLLVKASRSGRMAGALVVGTAAAALAAVAWFVGSDPGAGVRALAERPLELTVSAVAWGAVMLAWPNVVRDEGLAIGAAGLALAPLMLSALTLVEQVVGVAGPQPLMLEGVTAGSLLLIAGVVRLVRADADTPGRSHRALFARAAVVMPAALAVAGLALPALRVDVTAERARDSFVASWTLAGMEAVAGWAALALALLLIAAALDAAPRWPAAAGLLACASWPALLSTPTHVLNRWLPPDVQQYYGTEYATLSFTVVRNYPLLLAVAATAAGLLYLVFVRPGTGVTVAVRSVRETEGA